MERILISKKEEREKENKSTDRKPFACYVQKVGFRFPLMIKNKFCGKVISE